jgi:putative membrane protein
VAAVAQIFAIAAGLFHVMAFILESVVFHRPGVQRFLLGRSEKSPAVRLWAFNQGFYNLFLGVGAIIGAILWMSGTKTPGRTLVIYTATFMALCGVVLFVSDRTLWRGMIGQSTPPLVALAAALAA